MQFLPNIGITDYLFVTHIMCLRKNFIQYRILIIMGEFSILEKYIKEMHP